MNKNKCGLITTILFIIYGSDIFSGIQNIVSGNILETIKSVSNDER